MTSHARTLGSDPAFFEKAVMEFNTISAANSVGAGPSSFVPASPEQTLSGPAAKFDGFNFT